VHEADESRVAVASPLLGGARPHYLDGVTRERERERERERRGGGGGEGGHSDGRKVGAVSRGIRKMTNGAGGAARFIFVEYNTYRSPGNGVSLAVGGRSGREERDK
jgi:hypothetical protein